MHSFIKTSTLAALVFVCAVLCPAKAQQADETPDSAKQWFAVHQTFVTHYSVFARLERSAFAAMDLDAANDNTSLKTSLADTGLLVLAHAQLEQMFVLCASGEKQEQAASLLLIGYRASITYITKQEKIMTKVVTNRADLVKQGRPYPDAEAFNDASAKAITLLAAVKASLIERAKVILKQHLQLNDWPDEARPGF